MEQRTTVINDRPIIQANLVIEGIGGSLVLSRVHFNGVNVLPTGLELRVIYDGDIRHSSFTKNTVDDQRVQHTGPVIHQKTGPGDIFKSVPIPH